MHAYAALQRAAGSGQPPLPPDLSLHIGAARHSWRCQPARPTSSVVPVSGSSDEQHPAVPQVPDFLHLRCVASIAAKRGAHHLGARLHGSAARCAAWTSSLGCVCLDSLLLGAGPHERWHGFAQSGIQQQKCHGCLSANPLPAEPGERGFCWCEQWRPCSCPRRLPGHRA